MCRIVINPDQLGDIASLLVRTAGEYQAIGTQVTACNCGCMPADVAGVVDAVTADVRSSLSGVATTLAEEAAGLAWRAEVNQTGGFSAVGEAAWGGAADTGAGDTLTVGGFDGSLFGSSADSSTILVGGAGGFMIGGTGGGGFTVGGSDLDFGGTGGGSSLIIGGNDFGVGDSGGGGGGLVIGGNDFGLGDSGGGGGGLVIGGNDFGLGNSGGGGGGLVIGGTDLQFPNTDGGLTLTIYPEPLPEITLGPTGDPFLDDTAAWLASHRAASINLAASGFRFNGPTIFDVLTAQANSTLNWTASGGEYRYNYGEHSNFFYRPGELYGTRS